MTKVFLVNIDRCNGCRNCQIACKDEHCDQSWLPYSEAQPVIGSFWMNVAEKTRGQVPVVKISYTPTFCTHCEDAPCKNVGGSAVKTRDDGLVLIDPTEAKGRRDLVDACPLGAVYYNEALDLPQKCTGCAHLLDNGWEVPRCVDACATDALLYVDESEVDFKRAEFLESTAAFGPKVYYYNLPKRFVAGKLVDFEADEVVIGVKVDLLDATANVVATDTTDEFGDFFFDQVEAKAYSISYTSLSGTEKKVVADVTELDLNLGDLPIA